MYLQNLSYITSPIFAFDLIVCIAALVILCTKRGCRQAAARSTPLSAEQNVQPVSCGVTQSRTWASEQAARPRTTTALYGDYVRQHTAEEDHNLAPACTGYSYGCSDRTASGAQLLQSAEMIANAILFSESTDAVPAASSFFPARTQYPGLMGSPGMPQQCMTSYCLPLRRLDASVCPLP